MRDVILKAGEAMMICSRFTVCVALLSAMVAISAMGTDLSRYKLVEFKILKAAPEEYKNKRISTRGTYNGYTATIPEYMHSSGYKTGKYFLFLMENSTAIAFIIKKDDDVVAQIANLKRGSELEVYGKVKQFRGKPKMGMAPQFCLLIDEIVVKKEGDGKEDANQELWNRRNKFRR